MGIERMVTDSLALHAERQRSRQWPLEPTSGTRRVALGKSGFDRA